MQGSIPAPATIRNGSPQVTACGWCRDRAGMHLIEIAPDGTLLNARDFIIVAGNQ